MGGTTAWLVCSTPLGLPWLFSKNRRRHILLGKGVNREIDGLGNRRLSIQNRGWNSSRPVKGRQYWRGHLSLASGTAQEKCAASKTG